MIVADTYGYQVETDGGTIYLYRTPSILCVARIMHNGEIVPVPNQDNPYTRADHECAMAIRATMALG